MHEEHVLHELKRILESLQEEQVQSSFDNVLLLLLPLATFFLGAASIVQSPIMSHIDGGVATMFALVLAFLVYGILTGSDSKKIFAWYLFIIGLSAVLVYYSYTGILSVYGEPASVAGIYFFFGGELVVMGICLRPVRWIKKTMQRRLPMRAAEIDRVYHKLWKKSGDSYRFLDIMSMLAGFTVLFHTTRSMPGLPPYLSEPLHILAWNCGLSLISVLVSEWIVNRICGEIIP